MDQQIAAFEKKKHDLRKYLSTLDQKCKLKFGPLNKYVSPLSNPYTVSSIAEYQKKTFGGPEVDEAMHLKKTCKFIGKTYRIKDTKERYYPDATSEYECKKVKGIWDPEAINRVNKFDKGVCWATEQDKVCADKASEKLMRPYYSKFKDTSRERIEHSDTCNNEPGCVWKQQSTYTWDCVKGQQHKEEENVSSPPADMPQADGLESFLYRWYVIDDKAPLTTELEGEGNRCRGAIVEEDETPALPGEVPVKEYIDYRIIDPTMKDNEALLKKHMHPSTLALYKRDWLQLHKIGAQQFNEIYRGRSILDQFYARVDHEQFMTGDKETEDEPKPKRRRKKDALYPSVPQSIVNMVMKHTAMVNGDKRGMLAWHSTGSGKCHAKDTPILMYDGSIKKVQDIVVGDLLMGDDSTPRKVLSLATGQDEMYDVIPVKGDKYTVNAAHILCLKRTTKGTKSSQTKKTIENIVEIEVKDYLELPRHLKLQLKGYKKGVEFKEKSVDFDPYIIGVWLGDKTSISNRDTQILDYLRAKVPHGKVNVFTRTLRKYNMINNKHIPYDYKCNSRDIRLRLLAGLIDTDGSYVNGHYGIIQKNKTLSDDILFLARSLGYAAYQTKYGDYFRVMISGAGLEKIPVKVLRKQAKERKQIKDPLVTGITVKHVGRGQYYGFMIDGNHRYLLGDFTVTHNTCTATGVIDAFWDTDRPIIFASSIDAIASNPDYKFHECAMNLYSRFQKAPYIGKTKEESMALIAAAFKLRNIRFLTFAKLSNRVLNAEEYKKMSKVVKSTQKSSKDILHTEPYVDLDRAVLIIDEVHNLFRPLANQKKEHERLEAELLDPKKHPDMKIVILTATPGDNIPDVLKLLNIIRNPRDPKITFGDDATKFKKSIRGMVSYFDMSSDTTKFPVVYDDQSFIRAPMGEEQFKKYVEAYKSVKGEIKSYESLAKQNKLSKYWEPARKYANMLFAFDKDMSLSDFSSKMPYLLENIARYPKEKHYVYSAFYTKMGYGGQGIIAVAKELEKKGYKKLTVEEAKKYNSNKKLPPVGKRYILAVTTEIGEEGGKNLHELIKIYNSPYNKDGRLIHVMLASQGFNEGIDLKAVRHIHFFEPLVTMASDKQTLGRAARYCSHADLDRDAGEWSVKIHRYISDKPPIKVVRDYTGLISTLESDIRVLESRMSQEDLTNEIKDLREKKKALRGKTKADQLAKVDNLIEKKTTQLKQIKTKLKDDIKEKQREIKELEAQAKKAAKEDATNIENIEERIFKESRERMKDLLMVYQAMKEAAVDCKVLKQFHSKTGNEVKCDW